MHTYNYENYTFNYNSDLSGEVIIYDTLKPNEQIEIEGHALVEFVAEFIKNKKIAELENATTSELLGIEEY